MLGRIRGLLIRLLIFLSTPLEDERTAIWSIPKPLVPVYFLLFIGVSIWTIWEIASEKSARYCGFTWSIPVTRQQDCLTTWNGLVREVAAEYAPIGVGLAIGALIAMHGAAVIMAIYQFLTNTLTRPAIERQRARGREEGREEGRAQGLAEANRQWEEWLRRRDDAEAAGRPFDEPPPSKS